MKLDKNKKKQIKLVIKKAVITILHIFIVAIYAHVYHEGVIAYQFITENYSYPDRAGEANSNRDKVVSQDHKALKPTVAKTRVLPANNESNPFGEEGVVATPSPTSNKELIAEKAREVFGENEVEPLLEIVFKESSFNHKAQNPESTAYGLFQFLDSTWQNYDCEKTEDPKEQIECGIKYLKERYETPSKALAFHKQNNWY